MRYSESENLIIYVYITMSLKISFCCQRVSSTPLFFLPVDLGDVRIFLSQCPQCFVSEDVDPGGGNVDVT